MKRNRKSPIWRSVDEGLRPVKRRYRNVRAMAADAIAFSPDHVPFVADAVQKSH